MTIIPLQLTPLAARSDADFDQEFVRWADSARTTPVDITGWTFRFAVKADEFADDPLLEATSGGGGCVILDADAGRLAVRFDKAALAGALPDGVKTLDAVYALQAAAPGGNDEVWAAGKLRLVRGLD